MLRQRTFRAFTLSLIEDAMSFGLGIINEPVCREMFENSAPYFF